MASSGDRALHYGAAGAFLCFWALLSAWVIGGVGQEYRNDIRKGLALQENQAPSPERAERRETPAIEATGPIVLAPKAPAPSVPPEPQPTPALVADRSPLLKAEESIGPVAKAPVPTPAIAPSPPVDPFWEEPEQKKLWDLDHLTVEDERQLGLSLNQMIRKFHPPLKIGPLPRRLQEAAEDYLNTCTRKDVKYTFTVLDCESPNAFSLPGGYVYVCRGLFGWISEDEDYALEFLIAHEMAHVDLAHAVNCLRDPAARKLQLGTVPLFYFVAIPWGYKPEQEFEADRWAWDRMMKLGRSRYESLAFLRKLEDYSKSNGFENEPMKPMEEPKVPWLDNHIRTHPIPRDRLKRLKSPMDAPPRSKP